MHTENNYSPRIELCGTSHVSFLLPEDVPLNKHIEIYRQNNCQVIYLNFHAFNIFINLKANSRFKNRLNIENDKFAIC